MSRDAPPPPNPPLWQIQHVRLAAFTSTPQIETTENWWQVLTGTEPETEVRKKAERHWSGPFDDVLINLSIFPDRVQWIAGPVPASESNLTIGGFDNRLGWFENLMSRWLIACPPIVRLGFGALLWQPVSDHADGYQLLNRYLRSVEVNPSWTDFLFRANKRISSTTIEGLELNRLSTWSVTRTASFAIQLGGTSVITPSGVETPGDYFCSLDLDVNTIPVPKLDADKLVELFKELLSRSVSIANGDAQIC